MKKIIIAVCCAAGIFFILIFAGAMLAARKFPAYKQQKENEQNQMVIDYFCSLYEEDIEEVEITGCASLGSGNPVPSAGTDSSKTYEYKLRINNKYHATVWVNWETETFSLNGSDFPGTLIE